MRIAFTKMHGAGNDFIVFDAPADGSMPTAEQFRRLGDRRTGIGFDQALVLEPARRPGTAAFYRIFNSDGSEVEQCGNGVRCIAALLHRRARANGGTLALDSPAGVIHARVQDTDLVSVDMGAPRFDPRSLPFDAPREAPSYELEVGSRPEQSEGSPEKRQGRDAGQRVEIGAVSMGNPHAVLIVDSVDSAPVERLGAAIESHPRFPKRVNVGFMQILDRSHIRLRVYERGVGETLACGTGTCAAVVYGIRRGWLDANVHVSVRGGELRVNWDGRESGPIWLTGPAEVSFEGHVEV